MPKKQKKRESQYVVHGLRYLSDKSRSSNRSNSDSSRSLQEQKKSDATQQNGSLYVSSDWTENLFDQASLAEVDWSNASCYPYENIVMSGGGSKGYAFIGALKVQHVQ